MAPNLKPLPPTRRPQCENRRRPAQVRSLTPMPDAPTVSVVVPCFNAERWITATLASVQAQQWPALETIVIDDGSTDGTAKRVQREFPQARLVRQDNAGVAAARNHGVALAQGEWIAFIDADDWWLPDKLRLQLEALRDAQPPSGLCCSAWSVWTSNAPEPEPDLLEKLAAQADDRARWAGPSGWIYPQLLLDSQVWTSTVLVKRDLFMQAGGFDPSLRIGEDLDLWLRLSRLTPVVRVARPLALYRIHPDSITRAAPPRNYQAEVIQRALKRWGYDSPDGTRADPADVARALSGTWRDFAGAHLAAGNPGLARHGAWRSLQQDWRHPAGWKLLVCSLLGANTAKPMAGRGR